MTLQITGTTPTQFFNMTKEALEEYQGTNLRESTIRKFIKNLFRLENEHLYPTVFGKNATLTGEEFLVQAAKTFDQFNFIDDWGNGDESYIDRYFEVSSTTHPDNNDVTVDFCVVANCDSLREEDQSPIYFLYGKNYGEGDGMESPEYFYFENIMSGDIPLAEGVVQEELDKALPMIFAIMFAIKSNPALSGLCFESVNSDTIQVAKTEAKKEPSKKQDEPISVWVVSKYSFDTNEHGRTLSPDGIRTEVCRTQESFDATYRELLESCLPDHEDLAEKLVDFRMVNLILDNQAEEEDRDEDDVYAEFTQLSSPDAIEWLFDNLSMFDIADHLLPELTFNEYQLSYTYTTAE